LIGTSGQYYNFERIDIPTSKVNCIYQDREGVLWIGSYNGLIKYLGESYIVYSSGENDPDAISNNIVTSISEDMHGNLWVGTTNGLNLLNRKTESFISFFKNEDKGLCHNNIQKLHRDSYGNFWISGETGLCRMVKTESGDFNFVDYPLEEYHEMQKKIKVECFFEPPGGNLYIGTDNSHLLVYKKEDDGQERFSCFVPENPLSIPFLSIEELEPGILIIGTALNQFYFFDTRKKRFINKPFVSSMLNKSSSPGMGVYSMKKDKTGKLWVGMPQSLCIFDIEKKELLYSTDIFQNKNAGWEQYKDQAYTIYEDKYGTMWVSFMNLGLEKHVPGKFIFNQYKTEIKNPGTRRYYIKEIIEKNNLLYLATFGDGLLITGKKGNVKKRIDLSVYTNSVISNLIFRICFDANGLLWIASANGFHSYNVESEKIEHSFFMSSSEVYYSSKNRFTRLLNENDSTMWVISDEKARKFNPLKITFKEDRLTRVANSGNPIQLFYIDNEGDYWIRYPGRFLQYNPDKDTIITHVSKAFLEIASTSTNYMIQSSSGNYWFGTSNGLYMFNKEKRLFKQYKGYDKFNSDYITDIEEDHSGNIWAVNNQGLTMYNPATDEFIKFGEQNGLSKRADHIDQGTGNFFYITDESAFYCFHPGSLKLDSLHAPIYLTRLYLSGRELQTGESPLSGTTIQYKRQIELPYSKNSIGFRLDLLDYSSPEGHTYSYRLLGNDSSWVYIGNNNTVNFTGLPPGEYILEAKGKAQNKTGESISKQLAIIIHPPFWTSTWGFIFYGIIAFMVFMVYRIYTLKKMRRENHIVKEKMEMEKAREFDQMKMKFFFNISHEIRTPLTLISAPLSQLIKKRFTKEDSQTLALIDRNVARLKEMVNQILDAGKIQAGRYTPKIMEGNPSYLINDIIKSFKASCESKSISFQYTIEKIEDNYWYSPDAFEKIITNLLLNAVKYTDKGGIVRFEIQAFKEPYAKNKILSLENEMTPVLESPLVYDCRYAWIMVEDSGKGIEPNQLLKIFERYHQSANGQNPKNTGWGIGLSLTKELINQLNGSLYIHSYPTKGTKLLILMPLDKHGYPEDSVSLKEVKEYKTEPPNGQNGWERAIENIKEVNNNLIGVNDDKPGILLVEDNEDLLLFLQDLLKKELSVTLARNGKEALGIVGKNNFDLVVSDIMMPEMNGLELCKVLKNDIRTSHIPIILLTAKSSDEDEIKGLEIGADDYIAKPFNPDALLLRISRIMESRKKVWKKIDHGLELIPVEDKLTDYDSYLLNKIMETIRENISNPDFGPDNICKSVGISRSQLYRKTKFLANQPVNELIRNTRLNKAAEILREGKNINITELSYTLGFNKPGYFIELFKKKFGVTPKVFGKKNI
jgi:signal transduction histidine kinase/ligand-binding sensor domain-containing protein/CheY-like chemotaxis protein